MPAQAQPFEVYKSIQQPVRLPKLFYEFQDEGVSRLNRINKAVRPEKRRWFGK